MLKAVLLVKNCQLSKCLCLGSVHINQCGPSFDLCFLALLSVSESLLSAFSVPTSCVEEQMFSQSRNFLFARPQVALAAAERCAYVLGLTDCIA